MTTPLIPLTMRAEVEHVIRAEFQRDCHPDGKGGHPPTLFLLNELDATREALALVTHERNDFWIECERRYDIEPRAFFESTYKAEGWTTAIAKAMHHMWKRDPRVERLQADAQRLRETVATLQRIVQRNGPDAMVKAADVLALLAPPKGDN